MINVKGKYIIKELLAECVENGQKIRSAFTGFNNRIENFENFKRWRQRTYNLIHNYISVFEANKFWELPTNYIYTHFDSHFFNPQKQAQVYAHIASINSLIAFIEENNIHLKESAFETNALIILFALHNNINEEKTTINFFELSDITTINRFELALYLQELKVKKMIDFKPSNDGTFGTVKILSQGSKEIIDYRKKVKAEKSQTNQIMETYADKERLVLQTIYEMGKASPHNEANFNELLKAVNLPFQELITILDELEKRKGFLGNAHDECVKISPAGIEFLQGKSNAPSGSNITYYNIKDSTVGGIQHHTQNSNQFVNQKVSNVTNPEFNDAVKAITELIKTSSLSSFAKEDLISDIERIKQLAELEPSPELVEHAKSKINYLETAIKVTDLATKLSPYFPILYSYFERLTQ